MRVFEIIVALLLAGAGLAALSRRIGMPYPAMVAFAGAALALVPGTPTLVLDPDLARHARRSRDDPPAPDSIQRLRLEDDGSVQREVGIGRVETLRAALQALSGTPREEVSGVLRRRYELMLAREERATARRDAGASTVHGGGADGAPSVVWAATSAEREKLLSLRAAGTIGAEAFQ